MRVTFSGRLGARQGLSAALLVLTTLQPVGAQERLGPGKAFELVQEGTPACSIIIAERPSPAARLAALELQYHLQKISGAELPIHSESERVEGRRGLAPNEQPSNYDN